MSKDIALTITAFVRQYVKDNGRGCPKGALLHVGGFKAKDIQRAIECNLLESARGSEGGLFPAGERPAPKTQGSESLKSRLIDALRIVASGEALDSKFARALVEEYEAECAGRRKE